MIEDKFDIIIIGAGAAGLMAAGSINQKYPTKKVLIIEANKTAGRKIIISGGGRCNFTNMDVESNHFTSKNPHFMKSALKQYTQWDFIDKVATSHIEYYEKKLGQLFCKKSSKDILDLLLKRLSPQTKINYLEKVIKVEKSDLFIVQTTKGQYSADKLVVSSGGLSIPTIGASDIGYKVGRNFGHKIIETSPALVPFTLKAQEKELSSSLSGLSLEVKMSTNRYSVVEDMLFTHKGLSGPAVLKTSLYWLPGEDVAIDFLPKNCINEVLDLAKKKNIENALCEYLPNRLVLSIIDERIRRKKVAEVSKLDRTELENKIKNFVVSPSGTEGYRKAEVTRGGVDTKDISSKTMESKLCKGLYFIGEVLDVTGLLGGYNFQWAWSSANSMANHIDEAK